MLSSGDKQQPLPQQSVQTGAAATLPSLSFVTREPLQRPHRSKRAVHYDSLSDYTAHALSLDPSPATDPPVFYHMQPDAVSASTSTSVPYNQQLPIYPSNDDPAAGNSYSNNTNYSSNPSYRNSATYSNSTGYSNNPSYSNNTGYSNNAGYSINTSYSLLEPQIYRHNPQLGQQQQQQQKPLKPTPAARNLNYPGSISSTGPTAAVAASSKRQNQRLSANPAAAIMVSNPPKKLVPAISPQVLPYSAKVVYASPPAQRQQQQTIYASAPAPKQQQQTIYPSAPAPKQQQQAIYPSAPAPKQQQHANFHVPATPSYASPSATPSLSSGTSLASSRGVSASLKSGPPQPPFSPEMTLNYYRANLTMHEQQEIFYFPDIYFLGSRSIHKIGSLKRRAGPDMAEGNLSFSKKDDGFFNNGYDDSRGDYYLISHDHIAYRYEIIGALGKGSFGQVAKCYDHKAKKYVALKIIRNKKRFEKQGKIEVQVLDQVRLADHDDSHNCIHMLDYFQFRGHLCITFELLGTNLYEWLKAGGFKGINTDLIKIFTGQILDSLLLMQRNQIIHCDLKPENLLLCDPSNKAPAAMDVRGRSLPYAVVDSPAYRIKVIDFGSSCHQSTKIYTYVQSRFYRSPEIILGIPYTTAIDMWSLGCILAELHTGYPLFPGENEQEQLACMMELLGVPDMGLVERGNRRNVYFDADASPKIVPNSKGKKRRVSSKTLAAVLKNPNPLFIDFILRCLVWSPEERMTPSEAIRHEWITGVPALKRSSTGRAGVSPPSMIARAATAPELGDSGRLATSASIQQYKQKRLEREEQEEKRASRGEQPHNAPSLNGAFGSATGHLYSSSIDMNRAEEGNSGRGPETMRNDDMHQRQRMHQQSFADMQQLIQQQQQQLNFAPTSAPSSSISSSSKAIGGMSGGSGTAGYATTTASVLPPIIGTGYISSSSGAGGISASYAEQYQQRQQQQQQQPRQSGPKYKSAQLSRPPFTGNPQQWR